MRLFLGLFLVILSFLGCTNSKKLLNEKLHPATYLKTEIIYQNRLSDSIIYARLRVKNYARKSAYSDLTLMFTYLNSKGDSTGVDAVFYWDTIYPKQRISIPAQVFHNSDAISVRVYFTSGRAIQKKH